MGDFRASIKIQAEIYDVSDSCDMWINYDGESGSVYGVDRRVEEFFSKLHRIAWRKYQNDLYEDNRKTREREDEELERKELKRLKEKYET